MEYGSNEKATSAQVPHVRLGAHALERLYSGANGTTAGDIMLGSGALSREVLLAEFFKVTGAQDLLPKKECASPD